MIDFTSTKDTTIDTLQQSRKTLFLLERFGSEAYISQMNVSQDGTVEEAQVIDPAQFIEQLQDTSSNSLYAKSEILDERILVKSTSKLAWYYQPKPSQRLFYKQSGRTLNAKINWCTFVFVRVQKRLFVGVIQHNKRPNAKTRVYAAPLPNVYEKTGSICLGSCVLPDTMDIDKISETYLNSVKTHLNSQSQFRAKKTTTDKEYFDYISSKQEEKIKVSELAIMGTLSDFITQARG